VQLTGIVLTKLDGTAKGGIVIACQQELGLPSSSSGSGRGSATSRLSMPKPSSTP